jgi:succinyl-diaminopimelate desuccinylase
MTPDVPVERLVAFARDLIAIPTVNPPGEAYDQCVERIACELDALELPYEIVDTGTAEIPRRAIVSAATAPGRPLYLHGHYDVVPVFSAEEVEPYERGGMLVGRGSSDMKGGLASIVYAARACADRGLPVELVIVPDEETGGRLGSERLAELGAIDAGARGAIVAEPTWGTIWHGWRGAFTLRVDVRGEPAHVGLHYRGRNAFGAAVELARALQPLQADLRERRSLLDFGSDDPRAAESIMLVGGRAEGGVNFNVVPERFSFTIDRRPNPEEDHDAVRRELLDALDEARRRLGVEVTWEVVQDCAGGVTAPDDPLVRGIAAAAERHAGARPTITCCPGVLETRIYGRLGIPAVAFGPGLIDQMHGPAESVPVANLVAATAIYVDVAGLR